VARSAGKRTRIIATVARVTDAPQWLDATAQAELVRRRQASPRELVDAAIERIERLDPPLNAVIHPRFEKARAEADGSLPAGPFRGVPFVLKDLSAYSAGDPYHGGTRLLRGLGYTASHDSYLTQKFRAAGFIAVGRTNVSELGTTITTESVAWGPARNPWNVERSTGGSSGGSAAAVAAGMVAVGHANDGGGSIRIPAANCGLVGLKPSRARVSDGPDSGDSWMGSTVQGAVTRSVRDAAAVLDAIAGYMPGDPYTAPPPARPFAAEVGTDPGALRIGLLDHPPRRDLAGDPDCADAVHATGKLLESLGHHVEMAHPAALEERETARRFGLVVAAWTAADLADLETIAGRPLTDDDVEAENLHYLDIGRHMPAVDYVTGEVWLQRWCRRVVEWWHPMDGSPGFDILVSPVLNGPPPPLGYLADPEHGLDRMLELLQYTSQFNVTGQPAISLPLHWTADGLPIGVQFVGGFAREDVLIRLAAQVEAAQPWADRHPPEPF
jgi:amidase